MAGRNTRQFSYRLQLEGGKATEEDLQRARKAFDDFLGGVDRNAPRAKQSLDAFGESAERAGRRTREALKEPPPGLKALSSGAEAARGELNALASRVPVIGPALSAIGPAGLAAAAGIGAVTLAAHQALKTADELGDAAEQIGVSAKALQDYRFAAAGSAVDVQKLDAAITKFSANLGAAQDGAQQQQLAFLGLGVSIFDAGGKVRKTEDVFRDFADALAAIDEPQARAAAAATILGEKVGPKMAALLAQGAKGVDEAGAKLDRFGRVSDDTIKKADELDKVISQLTIQVKGFIAETVFQDVPRFLQRDIEDARALYKLYNDLLVHPLRKALEFATGGRVNARPPQPSGPDLTGGLRPPIADGPPLLNARIGIFQAQDAARGLVDLPDAKAIGEGLQVVAQGLGLVLDKGQLVRKEEVELAKATLAVKAAIEQGGEQLAAFGGDAGKAAAALEAVTLKLDPVRAAVKALKDEAALLRVPEGFERDLAKAAATLKEKLGRPLTDSDVKPLASAQFDTAVARAEDFARQTDQAAAAQERMAKASSMSAASQREAARANALAAEALKLGLNPAQVQYIRDTGQIPFVNAKAAAALGETAKAFDRQNKAIGSIDARKFSDQARIAVLSAENLADAAGLGEAAARKAAQANAVLAAGDHAAAEEAKQAALELVKVREIRNEIINGLDREIEANNRLAAASAKGAAAAALQATEEAKLAAALRLGEEATAELAEVAEKLAQARVASANRQAGEAAGRIKDEVAGQNALIVALDRGRDAAAKVEQSQEALTIARKAGFASLEALNAATDENSQKLAKNVQELLRNTAEREANARIIGIQRRGLEARDELTLLRAETSLIGANAIERARIVQALRDQLDLKRQLAGVEDPDKRAKVIAEHQELQRFNQELAEQRVLAEQARDNARAFTEPWVRAFDIVQDKVGEIFRTGKVEAEKFVDIGKQLASEWASAWLRINVFNPVGAALGIPGIVNTSGLFGGGTAQAAASAPAQSLAGGALNAAGNVNSAISFFDRVGKFIDNPSATFDSIGNFFSNPFGLFGPTIDASTFASPAFNAGGVLGDFAFETGVGALAGGGAAAGSTTSTLAAASLIAPELGGGAAAAAGVAGSAAGAGAAGGGALAGALSAFAAAAPYLAAAAVAVMVLMSVFKKTPHPTASFGFLPTGAPGDYDFSATETRAKHISADAVTKIGEDVLQPYLRQVGKQYGITYGAGQIFSAFGDKTYKVGHDFFGAVDTPGTIQADGGPADLRRRIFQFDPENAEETRTALARLTLSLIQTATTVDDASVKTAAANISLEASGGEIEKALNFAGNFTQTMQLIASGFDPVESQMAQIGEAADEFGERLKTTVTEFKDHAVELKLATPEEANAALQTLLKATLGLVETGKPLEGLALSLAQTKANFDSLSPALKEAGFSATEAVALIEQGFAKFKAELGDQFLEGLGRQANEAMGKGFLNSLGDIGTRADALFADALRLFDASDPRLAEAVQGVNDVFGGLVEQTLGGLNADQLRDVIATYHDATDAQGAFIRQMAENTLAWREATAGITEAGRKLIEDLTVRELRLSGDDRGALARQGELDKARQLAAAAAEGLDPDQLRRLADIIDGELNNALDEFDRQVTETAAAVAKASREFADNLTARELRLAGDQQGAALEELRQRQAAEIAAAEAAGRTTEEIARLSAVLQGEFQQALDVIERQTTDTLRRGGLAIEQAIDPDFRPGALDVLLNAGISEDAAAGLGDLSVAIETLNGNVESAAALTAAGELLGEALESGAITADQYNAVLGYLTGTYQRAGDTAGEAAQEISALDQALAGLRATIAGGFTSGAAVAQLSVSEILGQIAPGIAEALTAPVQAALDAAGRGSGYLQLAADLGDTIEGLAGSLTPEQVKSLDDLVRTIIAIGDARFEDIRRSIEESQPKPRPGPDPEQLAREAEERARRAAAINADVMARLLESQGRALEAQLARFDVAAEAQKREAEETGADLRKLNQVLDAERRAIIDGFAAQAARFNDDLQVRLLRAQGKELDAQLLAFDQAAERQHEEQRRLGGDAALLNQVLTAERQKIIDSFQDIGDALEETLKRAIDQFRGYVEGLGFGSTSPLTPEQKLAEAQAAFAETVTRARERDAAAIEALPRVAETLLEQARGFYASGAGFTALFAMTRSTLQQLLAQLGSPTTLPSFATGGRAEPGWALVGEGGAELVRFGRPAQVFPAEVSRRLEGALAGDAGTLQELRDLKQIFISVERKLDALLRVTAASGDLGVEELRAMRTGIDEVKRKINQRDAA